MRRILRALCDPTPRPSPGKREVCVVTTIDSRSIECAGTSMPIPREFKDLIEQAEATAPVPDYVWMSFAVCVLDESACGWSGWIIESAWKENAFKSEGAVSRHRDDVLSAADSQKCPDCGKQTFRTAVEKRFVLDKSDPVKITYPPPPSKGPPIIGLIGRRHLRRLWATFSLRLHLARHPSLSRATSYR
jgi:hypothetical protein